MSGVIPDFIGQLTKLGFLGLEENQIEGALRCRSSDTPL
jgi:hypothetical protein